MKIVFIRFALVYEVIHLIFNMIHDFLVSNLVKIVPIINNFETG